MKPTVLIPTRSRSRATLLSGCVVLALATAAFGQADRQSTTRPAGANVQSTDDQATFEGKLLPLFHALNGHDSNNGDPLKLNRQPGQSTKPDSAAPGRSSSTQSGGAGRSQAGLPAQSGTTSAQLGLDSSPSSMGAAPVAQPLALIVDSGSSSNPTERSPSNVEGRPSTPPAGSTSAGTAQGSTATGNPGASQKTQDGGVYVLVFDPTDQESRTAYLMAQAIVRAETTGSTDAIGTQGGSLGTPGPARTSTTPETPANRPDSTATPGASGANRENERGQNTQRSATPHSSEALSGMGERVKITGRVIEREGVQAIAVQRVERQHGDSTASVSTTRGR